MTEKIKIVLLTGFLGAGKTTILNSVIKHNADLKFALIENEFGEENIDSKLIKKKQTDHIYELTNGCLCCDMQNGLIEALAEIAVLEIKPDYVFVELSGLADPQPVLSILNKDPDICEIFEMLSVACLIHPLNIDTVFDDAVESVKQVVDADVIVVSREDQINEKHKLALKQRLAEVNPFAQIVFSEKGSAWPFLMSKAEKTDRKFALLTEPVKGEHSSGITSEIIRVSKAFPMQKLTFWMEMYLSFNPSVYRVKASVLDRTTGNAFILQAVGRDVECMLDESDCEDVTSIFVFIGRNIDRAAIIESLDDLLSDQLEKSSGCI